MIVTAIAERVEAEHPETALLLPTLWLGYSPHHVGFAGALTAAPNTYIDLLCEILEPIIELGFRKILALNGHGGNECSIRMALRLAGVHCCGNTDWALLLKTEIDILSFDAYEFFDKLMLYPEELNLFFKRGGILSWGIVPSLQPDMLAIETTDSLIAKFEKQVSRLTKITLDVDLVKKQSFITPSCAAGSLTEELAVRALQLTSEVSQTLRKNLE